MDIEFHYYINYLIAIKAGFNLNEAGKIAYSAQFIDDNSEEIIVRDGTQNKLYKSTLTQSYQLFRAEEELRKIHLCFHFIPGEPGDAGAIRKDGKGHMLATTPRSFLATKILRHNLASQNAYAIGIASHSFADTWAHANFTGTWDDFNALNYFPQSLIPNIGHADFLDRPDKMDLVWKDDRLIEPIVNNKEKFLAAAQAIFTEYKSFLFPKREINKEESKELISDLSGAIGKEKQYDQKTRIVNYRKLAIKYSGKEIMPYKNNIWKESALLKTNSTYQWRSNHLQSDWYLFQESAKAYQGYAWKLISKRVNMQQNHDPWLGGAQKH